MRTTHILGAALLGLVCLPILHAQDSAKDAPQATKAAPEQKPKIPLKIQVTLSEFDGNQKISSLPYMIHTIAGNSDDTLYHPYQLRFGVRIPVALSSAEPHQFQYEDVGTDIDCAATTRGESQYTVAVTIDRTSVINVATGKEAEWKAGDSNVPGQPLLRHFRDQFLLVMRDGQTMEGVSAVDPATGRVLKVDVTLNVAK